MEDNSPVDVGCRRKNELPFLRQVCMDAALTPNKVTQLPRGQA